MKKTKSKEILHMKLYDKLADKYKEKSKQPLVYKQLWDKAKRLRSISNGNNAIEIGLGGGLMNYLLQKAGFKTTGIDISCNMIKNTKTINPHGHYILGDYTKTDLKQKYDLIIGLAFIHLFSDKEAKRIIAKMYNDLNDGGVLYLTTTKEEKYEYSLINKNDYGKNCLRYRARHTPLSFVSLFANIPFDFEKFKIEKDGNGKEWISLLARK